uniref:Uncharacterized protein n=1 Tax=Tanacetum cinerariifolium TaxID=118510 RepID=A0A699SAG8_TANCI|nr:hypothetical protein [Tanacetum cinerariifolium]
MEECYKALSDRLDWTNPKGDRCTYDLSKPLPKRGKKVYHIDHEDKGCEVDKQSGYGYLEEIVVRRADRQLYTFKKGDFINLHLNDIEDMILLVVQHKLFHLYGDVLVDLAVALRMFT